MSIDIAIDEFRTRRAEAAEAEADGSWEAWAAMKKQRSLRRRALRWSRGKMDAWLQIAERHADG